MTHVPEELTGGNPWAAGDKHLQRFSGRRMWLWSHATGIDQAAGEVVKTPLA